MYSLLQTQTRSDGSNKYKLLRIPGLHTRMSVLKRPAEASDGPRRTSSSHKLSGTARQQPHKNNVRVAEQQQEAKIHFLQLQTDNQLLLWGFFSPTLTVIGMMTEVPTIWIWASGNI